MPSLHRQVVTALVGLGLAATPPLMEYARAVSLKYILCHTIDVGGVDGLPIVMKIAHDAYDCQSINNGCYCDNLGQHSSIDHIQCLGTLSALYIRLLCIECQLLCVFLHNSVIPLVTNAW